MSDVAIRALVRGKVQQVGYRLWTVREAAALGLRGWVRNRADGNVEALFIGPVEAVEAMLLKCRRGPRLANVSVVERQDATDDGSQGFTEAATP